MIMRIHQPRPRQLSIALGPTNPSSLANPDLEDVAYLGALATRCQKIKVLSMFFRARGTSLVEVKGRQNRRRDHWGLWGGSGGGGGEVSCGALERNTRKVFKSSHHI
ncbi:uncharacterized protein RCO7_15081 [Rhynchosporium graminicola]|uniref:Uncharacterized protein n=1 Tax=Rhynchosporium graminicola TaxID=2792576 RepID=A0A1E1LJH2_9HELO|nr:uncharacterized protein RCO7_15081 [Rhynchosporium commune]